MSKVEVIPYTPPDYWNIKQTYDGIYSICRWHQRNEFVTKFPIIMKVKVNVPLKNQLGAADYVSYIIEAMNEPPPAPEYKGRGRRPKPKPPMWGKVELIRHKFKKEKDLDILELIMYTNKKKNKRLLNFSSMAQGTLRPDGRKNRKKNEHENEV